MGLEQYIVALVTFVNNLVIPFLMGLAFLFFVINAVRFFVVGGANSDSKEKARSLAVYGLLAFVLIIVFWGIVGLLSSSLGLQALGERNARCFDYDPDCDPSSYAQTSGGADVSGISGNTGIGDIRPAGTGDSSGGLPLGASPSDGNDFFPSGITSAPDESNPSFSDSPSRPGSPDMNDTTPFTPGPELQPVLDRETAISPTVQGFISRDAEDIYGYHTDTVTSLLYADLSGPQRNDDAYTDVDRLQAIQRLEQVDAVTSSDVTEYFDLMRNFYDNSVTYSPTYFEGTIVPAAADLAMPLPGQIRDEQNETIRLASEELRTYYSGEGNGLNSTEVDTRVAADVDTLRTGTAAEREVALENLYDTNKLRDFDGTIYNRFIEDLNTELAFQGEEPL